MYTGCIHTLTGSYESESQKLNIVDTWIALTAVAMNTPRIRFETTVTTLSPANSAPNGLSPGGILCQSIINALIKQQLDTNTPDAERLEVLSLLVSDYESKHTPSS